MQALIVATLLVSSWALSVGIEGGAERCFYLDGIEGQLLTVSYVASGLSEENVQLRMINHQQEVIYHVMGKPELTYEKELPATGEYTVCFGVIDQYFKTFSFDFDINGVDKNYAQSHHMNTVLGQLSDAHHTMQIVSRNQHFQSDRDDIHSRLLNSTERKVKWCALGKMTVLMVICLVQIYLLTNFFKDKSFGNQV